MNGGLPVHRTTPGLFYIIINDDFLHFSLCKINNALRVCRFVMFPSRRIANRVKIFDLIHCSFKSLECTDNYDTDYYIDNNSGAVYFTRFKNHENKR